MPLLTLNLSCENVKYPARKHFEKTNKDYTITKYTSEQTTETIDKCKRKWIKVTANLREYIIQFTKVFSVP